jgi:hypothetical protein
MPNGVRRYVVVNDDGERRDVGEFVWVDGMPQAYHKEFDPIYIEPGDKVYVEVLKDTPTGLEYEERYDITSASIVVVRERITFGCEE